MISFSINNFHHYTIWCDVKILKYDFLERLISTLHLSRQSKDSTYSAVLQLRVNGLYDLIIGVSVICIIQNLIYSAHYQRHISGLGCDIQHVDVIRMCFCVFFTEATHI